MALPLELTSPTLNHTQPQGKEPLPAVGAFVRTGKQVNGNEFGEVCGQLLEGALAVRRPRAASRARKAGKSGVFIGTVILLCHLTRQLEWRP